MKKFLLFILLVIAGINSNAQFQGNALDFDGTNDMVVVSSVPALFSSLSSSDFTFEAWVYPRASAFQRIFFAQPSTTNFTAFGTGNGNVIYFYVVANGTNYSAVTTAAIPQNQWTHVAGRWTASTLTPTIFFNGVQQATNGGGTSSTGTNGLMTLGTRPGGFQYFNGMIDQARLWNTARTPCQLTSNMNRDINVTDASLLVNFNFNQGTAGGTNTGLTNLPDVSGNAYNGTLTNFGLTGATSNWVTSNATINAQGAQSTGGPQIPLTASVCSGGSLSFPDGSSQSNITAGFIQNSTIAGPGGCDTLYVTTVSVNPVYADSETVSICPGGSYTYPDGTTDSVITAPVVHLSSLTTTLGCDSTITTIVNLNATSLDTVGTTICEGGSVSFPDGTTVGGVTSPFDHTSTLQNSLGCDSVIVTQVLVNPIFNLSDTATVCAGESFTFADGTTTSNITAPLQHTSSLTTAEGCDSVLVTQIFVTTIDTTVTTSGPNLSANASGATYQWLDCDDGLTPISGETGQNFTALNTGNYAVAITQNGCTDTSNCHFVLIVSAQDPKQLQEMTVFPNPTSGLVNVEFSATVNGILRVTDLAGAAVQQVNLDTNKISLDLSGLPSGIYLLTVQTESGSFTRKLRKE